MHEYSIISSLFSICLEYLESHNATSIQKVIVSVGERANIEKSLLISAFETLKIEYSALSNAKIAIITQKLLLECNECKHSFHSVENPTCPMCQSTDTYIIKGRDIKLESLELEIDEGA